MKSYIIANLHNLKTDRYHPLVFSSKPHSSDTGNAGRYKTMGHHTNGFDTRQQSIAECNAISVSFQSRGLGTPEMFLEKDFPWDGEDTPAMVLFFIKTDDGVRPAF